jgi:hypothetical protein
MSDEQPQDATIAQEAAAPAVPSLSLQDLVLALQTMQACAQRGAIKADEMTTVGGLYDRMFAFLESQGVISRGTTPEAAAETPAEEQNA